MPRYAIKQARAFGPLYTEADDTLDAINWARRVLIDHATHGELFVARLPDKPPDEGDAQSELRYEENDDDRETERRKGLQGVLSDPEGMEPW